MRKKFICYLRPNRRRCGLNQTELGNLVGANSGAVISRIESGERLPSLTIALGCQVLFGIAPAEMFPSAFAEIESETITRAYNLYDGLQGASSTVNRLKLDFLEQAFARAIARLKKAVV